VVSDGATETLRVKLLGGFSVSVGDREIGHSEWRLKKAAALVKLLTLAPSHRLHREQIMDFLWPDSGRKAASNSLRRTLHAARRTLDPAEGSHYLAGEEESLVLCPTGELWVDVDAFERAAATARRSREPAAYRGALELYAGDLLPEDRYQGWAEARREELRRLRLALLAELAALYEERDDLASATEALQGVLAEEPADEGVHAALIRLHALSGSGAEALVQYGRLERALSRELGAEPSASSRALREEIAAGRFPPTETYHSGSPPKETQGAKHNLPAQRTTFVGREREVVEVKRALAMTRVLTLTGTGGAGKTRLALEVAKGVVSAYPEGVWLVELASLLQPELVPQSIAEELGVREQPGKPLVDTLVDRLRGDRLLLLLDNCEHLIEACATLADALLLSCTNLTILATSRQVLGIAGEMRWRVPSLAVPDPRSRAAVAELLGCGSVRLFLERARLRDPAFALTIQNAQAVSDICRRLDGIPLAIELAAARVGMLSVVQVSEKLGDSLALLSTGDRTAPARQRTLEATLDWSFGLLVRAERILFCRLSVFAGGWTLEAAETVGSSGGIEKEGVLDLLSQLVDKSLVAVEASGNDRMRYRMLEPLRQYGQRKLEQSGEADSIKGRHAALFLALAEEAEQALLGPDQGVWLERLDGEHDNLRAALTWALEAGESELALRLSGALGDFWYLRGRLTEEGRGWLEAALKQGTESPAVVRVKALARAGSIAMEQRDFDQVVVLSDEGLALSRESGDKAGAASSLFNLGMVALLRNENAKAIGLFEEAAELARDIGDVAILSLSKHGLGLSFMQLHDFERATALQRENLTRARETGDEHMLSMSIGLAGLIALGEGDYERAESLGSEALMMFWRMGQRHYIPTVFWMLAAAAAGRGNVVRSARLCGASHALHEALGTRLSAGEHAYFEHHFAAARTRLDDTAWESAWSEGRAMALEQAVEYALGAGRSAASHSAETKRDPDRPLTRREEQVAALVARGLTNRQIAGHLSISESTIETHVARIFKKLDLHSRTQLTAWLNDHRSALSNSS
jgi:predicted ATPase/DNA-binding SARP family transcriptional activator/DNA-binding CsgD family transcriptional regulator